MSDILKDTAMRFATLHALKQQADGMAKQANIELAEAQELLLTEFSHSGIQSIKMAGDSVMGPCIVVLPLDELSLAIDGLKVARSALTADEMANGNHIAIDKALDNLESQLVASRASRTRLRTIYMHAEAWAFAKTSKQLVGPNGEPVTDDQGNPVMTGCADESFEALRNYEPTSTLVKNTINARSLSSVVRELDTDDEGGPILPDEIKDAVTIDVRRSVRARLA